MNAADLFPPSSGGSTPPPPDLPQPMPPGEAATQSVRDGYFDRLWSLYDEERARLMRLQDRPDQGLLGRPDMQTLNAALDARPWLEGQWGTSPFAEFADQPEQGLLGRPDVASLEAALAARPHLEAQWGAPGTPNPGIAPSTDMLMPGNAAPRSLPEILREMVALQQELGMVSDAGYNGFRLNNVEQGRAPFLGGPDIGGSPDAMLSRILGAL